MKRISSVILTCIMLTSTIMAQKVTVITDSISLPFALAVDSAETFVYASCQGSSNVTRIDLATGARLKIASAGSYGICFSKDYSKLILGGGSSSASTIQTLTIPGYTLATLSTGFLAPSGLCLDQSGANVYVCDRKNNLIKKVDLVTGTSTDFFSSTILNKPYGMTFDKTYSFLWVCNSMSHNMLKISFPGGQLVDSIPSTNTPQIMYPMGAVVDASGKYMYVCSAVGNIFKVDLQTKAVIEYISATTQPLLGDMYNICIDRTGKHLYCGGFSSSRLTKVELDVTDVKEYTTPVLPEKYSLKQNYPNPFNPETLINYALAGPGKISLKVYDLLGNEVKTLFAGEQTAGEHTVRFSAEGLPSGCYVCRLQTNDGWTSIKMILTK